MYEGLYAPIPDVAAYLERLGCRETPTICPNFLDQLVHIHQCSIVFENLDIIEKRTAISLHTADLYEKIIQQKRGGYCFELNALFTRFLKALGFDAYGCMCRIIRKKDFLPPMLHRAVLVNIGETLYFCDVGYGGPSAACALPVADGSTKTACGETFQISRRDAYWWCISRITSCGETEDVMLFTTQPQDEVDFVTMNYYCSTSPDSVFTQQYYVNVRTPKGNKHIMGNEFAIEEDGLTASRLIASEEERKEILRREFSLFL